MVGRDDQGERLEACGAAGNGLLKSRDQSAGVFPVYDPNSIFHGKNVAMPGALGTKQQIAHADVGRPRSGQAVGQTLRQTEAVASAVMHVPLFGDSLESTMTPKGDDYFDGGRICQ